VGVNFWFVNNSSAVTVTNLTFLILRDTVNQQDKPKHLGIAIDCPLTLDDETGYWNDKSILHHGLFCKPLAELKVQVEIYLRPTAFTIQTNEAENSSVAAVEPVLMGTVWTNPSAGRAIQAAELIVSDGRVNAVCTVQTFKNPQTGDALVRICCVWSPCEYVDDVDGRGDDHHCYALLL
jgi:hypothetical protein